MGPSAFQPLGSSHLPPGPCSHLIEHHPVGVYLGVTLGVQHHGLEGPKIGEGDLGILRTNIDLVHHLVSVEVALARITYSIP